MNRLINTETAFFNELSEEFTREHDATFTRPHPLPQVATREALAAEFREEAPAMESYPVTATGSLQPEPEAPVLIRMTVRQAT